MIERVIQQVLGNEASGVSTYNADTIDPFDIGHALGVIAEGISQGDFRASRGKKRKSSCTRASLIIPVSWLMLSMGWSAISSAMWLLYAS